jgi:hypothetical protein
LPTVPLGEPSAQSFVKHDKYMSRLTALTELPTTVIVSYYGWSGKRDSFDVAKSLTATLHSLKIAGFRIDFIAQSNDSGYSFDEIVEYRVSK